MFRPASLSLLAAALSLSTTGVDARALTRSKGIQWDPCTELNKNLSILTAPTGPFEPVECGTLPVPLDYTADDSPKLELDLFRVKATKEPVLGTVLYNPGGPGGAAGDNFPPAVSDLRTIIGEQYNILSWDPRGTGKTIPFNGTAMFGSADLAGAQPQKRDLALPLSNMTGFFLNGGWDLAEEIAEAAVPDNKEIGSLIGTPFVARDMLEIVDALDEDGMLRYYGWSYGTVLGSYFATMFPDRVDRMVLDANLDPADYRDGTWGNSLEDTDKTFEAFLDACIENKDECALAAFLQANSSQDISDALNLVLAPLAANVTDFKSLSTLAELKAPILTQLYFPSRWPALAEMIVLSLNTTAEDAAAPESDSEQPTEAPWTYDEAVYSIFGIRASDATWKPTSAEEYLPQVEYQASLSGFSDGWYWAEWVSARWKMPAKERYYGNFTAKTNHPILYVNGEYDPVTPIAAARSASKGFEGSVVLAHSGFGHGLIADPSSCAHEYTRAYFKDGSLPEEGTHCEPDLGPWELAKVRNGTMMGALPSK